MSLAIQLWPSLLIYYYVGLKVHCYDYCQYGSDNTMCRYPTLKPGSACGTNLNKGLTAEDKKKIVDLHNELRAKVAKGNEKEHHCPTATNMETLEWDDEVATFAEHWIYQCVFEHDPDRIISRFLLGQNLYYMYSIGAPVDLDVSNAIHSWYNEVKHMTKGHFHGYVSRKTNPAVGHFTQMVWGQTKYVGCGRIVVKDGNRETLYFACDYGPTGNYVDTPLYNVGKPCSECDECSAKYKVLCGKGGATKIEARLSILHAGVIVIFFSNLISV